MKTQSCCFETHCHSVTQRNKTRLHDHNVGKNVAYTDLNYYVRLPKNKSQMYQYRDFKFSDFHLIRILLLH